MKYIRYHPDFLGVEGFPIRIVDPDARKQRESLEEARAAQWPLGANVYSKAMIEEATFAQVVMFLINDGYGHDIDDKGRPKRIEGASGMVSAASVIRAFQYTLANQLDWVALEQTDYDWIVEWTDSQGPFALRMDMALIKERLQDICRTPDGKEANPHDLLSSIIVPGSNGHEQSTKTQSIPTGVFVGTSSESQDDNQISYQSSTGQEITDRR